MNSRGTSQLRTRSSRCGSTSPPLSFWSTWFPGSKARRLGASVRHGQVAFDEEETNTRWGQSASQNILSRAGHDLCITWIKIPRKKTKTTKDTRMWIGRKTRQWRMMSRLTGTHWPSNRKPLFRRVPRPIARKEILRAPIQPIVATSCTREKEKAHQRADVNLFFS
jgi:hypothetical protein